ncbi:MAG TPA: M48 family metallopeptidase, partial [Thermoanaerobaculia bacterium]
MLKKSLVFAVPLLLIAVGCGTGGLGGGISLDEEWQLGNQLAAQVESQVQLVRDPQALAYIRMVGERIHAVTPLANRPFDFEVINDSTVNAFSLPGGHIYLNTGLIAQADKVDMLAGVMAHEISHVVARHAIKQVQQQQEISVIAGILLGQNPNALAQIAAQVLAGGAMARFSRADEKQADDMGLDFMNRAGYDPHGMLDMFQKLLAMERRGSSAVARFFQDHPGTQDRIDDISGRIARMGRTSGIVDDPD